MIAALIAAHLFAAPAVAVSADPRPVVRVVFTIRPDHPYTLQWRDVPRFERLATVELMKALEKVRFLRFKADEGEHTLYLLLDDRDAGVADEDLREIWLFAALNEPVTRDNARMTWVVRRAGEDNAPVGNEETFARHIGNAVRKSEVGTLVEKCFRSIDIAGRARKPARTAYWLMPFHIDDLKVGDRSLFRVWAPAEKYAAEPHDVRDPIADATDEYAGKTVTTTREDRAVVEKLEKAGRIDAHKVRLELYVAPDPPPQGQAPAGVKLARPK